MKITVIEWDDPLPANRHPTDWRQKFPPNRKPKISPVVQRAPSGKLLWLSLFRNPYQLFLQPTRAIKTKISSKRPTITAHPSRAVESSAITAAAELGDNSVKI